MKIDETKMAERPQGVTEAQWRGKLLYEAVEAERSGDPDALTRADYAAKEAADAVRRGGEPKQARSSKRS